jgi:hypothetical protein
LVSAEITHSLLVLRWQLPWLKVVGLTPHFVPLFLPGGRWLSPPSWIRTYGTRGVAKCEGNLHGTQFSNLENFKHQSLYAKFEGYIEGVLAWDLSYSFPRNQLFFAQKPGIMTVCSYALTHLNLGTIPI